MKVVIIMGSTADEPHAKKITDNLDAMSIPWEQHAASSPQTTLGGSENPRRQRERRIPRIRNDRRPFQRAFRFRWSQLRLPDDRMPAIHGQNGYVGQHPLDSSNAKQDSGADRT